MPNIVRASKFRHVSGVDANRDQCYEGIGITQNAAYDSNFCAVNPKFIAMVIESTGGGSFVVKQLQQTGRVTRDAGPKVTGHSGPVTDIKWSPFNDNIIASCSEDTTIKVWQIPESGLVSSLSTWLTEMTGHSKRVNYIEWHPTVEHILLSAAADFKCILWNTKLEDCLRVFSFHPDIIFSISWNRDGSMFATTCKDKMIRIIDPRRDAIVAEGKGHTGTKASKVVFIDKKRVFTCGFSKMSDRQCAIWNIDDFSKPMKLENIDVASSLIIPFYDYDTKVIFIAGKGDGNIRYYEIVDEAPYIHFLNEYHSNFQQRGLGLMAKRGVNTSRCEIARFYKLYSSRDLCQPISMVVPRKAGTFQEDLYPPTASTSPSLTAKEWLSGLNKDPLLISMKDSSSAVIQSTNTAASTLADKRREAGHSTNGSVASCSTNGSISVPVQPMQPAMIFFEQTNTVSDKKSTTAHNDVTSSKTHNDLTSSKTCGHSVNAEVLSSGFTKVDNNINNIIPISSSTLSSDKLKTENGTKSNGFAHDCIVPLSDVELQKAFIAQSKDITNLKEQLLIKDTQLSLKDRRIEQLEEDIQILKMTVSARELNATTKC